MRLRILDATLHCLAQYGYAGTGVSQVVAQAGVSRGAWSHHFPSMNALILEAAQHLMARVYARLGVMLADSKQAEHDGMRGMVESIWREFFGSEVNDIYLELLVASRRNPELAAMLGQLSLTLEQNLGNATARQFRMRPDTDGTTAEMMLLNRWVLRGIALDAPLMSAESVSRALDAWAHVLASHVEPVPAQASVLKPRRRA